MDRFFLETHCKRFLRGSCLWFLWLLCAFIALSSMVRENAVSLLVIVRVFLLLCICIFWEGEAFFFQDDCVGLY
jgi:ABC-type transport system involved in multi-copper enzyme maturation permease subunit